MTGLQLQRCYLACIICMLSLSLSLLHAVSGNEAVRAAADSPTTTLMKQAQRQMQHRRSIRLSTQHINTKQLQTSPLQPRTRSSQHLKPWHTQSTDRSPTRNDASHSSYLLHFKAPITTQMQEQLVQALKLAGGKLNHYVADHSYHVTLPKASAASLRNLHGLLLIQQYEPTMKIASSLQHIDSSSKTALRGKHYNPVRNHHTLRVHVDQLQAEQHDSTLQSLAERWQQMLRSQDIDCDIWQSTERHVDISVHTQHANDAINYLSHRAAVHYIEPKSRFTLQNKYVKTVIQSDANKTSIFSHNILGDNQIITMGDTGVDHDSCFFHDPLHAVPINTTNFEHRKIVGYVAHGDDRDGKDGHGTHVAGTLVGQVTDESSPVAAYNGNAPHAKLAVFDFQADESDELLVPDDIITSYYQRALTEMHSHITSNSWGSEQGDYDSFCQDTDKFVWENPTFNACFACGNYGDLGFSTVSSPGVAKNVLTVGSTKSSPESFIAIGADSGIEVTQPSSVKGRYSVTPAAFGPAFAKSSVGSNVEVVAAKPYDACASIPANTYSGQIVLVQRGTCPFTQKTLNAQEAGASMVLIVNNVVGDTQTIAGGECPGCHIPAVLISKTIGEAVHDTIINFPALTVKASAPVTVLPEDENERWLSEFSSRGPVVGGRRKPDVLGVGEMVTSVRSDGVILPDNQSSCPSSPDELIPLQGTSMAAPAIAAAAALVRQYFMDGFYPTGQANAEHALEPSSALVKAMLTQSAVSCSGSVTTKIPTGIETHMVQPAPSMFQGFGRVLLDNVLKFDSTSLASMKVYNDKQLRTGDMHSYCYRVIPGQAAGAAATTKPLLRATMAYHDAPIDIAAEYVLVNNVDLFVTDLSTGAVYIGNHHAQSQTLWDDVNNVEQVHIADNSTEGTTATTKYFSLHVRGTNVPVGPQPYALVVQGAALEEVPLNQCTDAAVQSDQTANAVLCPNNCNAPHGRCDTEQGVCICTNEHGGADCTLIAQALDRVIEHDKLGWQTTATQQVNSMDWSYYYFDITADDMKGATGLAFLVSRNGQSGDPDLYLQLPSASAGKSEAANDHPYPSLANYHYANLNCDSCPNPDIIPSIIPAAEVHPGRVRAGVYGYCCDSTEFDVVVMPYFGPLPSETTKGTSATSELVEKYAILAPLLVIIVFLAGALCYAVYLLRKQRGVAYVPLVNAPGSDNSQQLQQPPAQPGSSVQMTQFVAVPMPAPAPVPLPTTDPTPPTRSFLISNRSERRS